MTHQNLILTEKAIKRHSKRLQHELLKFNIDLKLTESQDMLSRIIGMKDFHELKQIFKFENSSNIKIIDNKFNEFKEFDLDFLNEILDYFVINNLSSITIDENNGINLFLNNKFYLKINTKITKEILNLISIKLYGSDFDLNVYYSGNSYDFAYNRNNMRFRVNIMPVDFNNKNSLLITIKAINNSILNWQNINTNINPLDYTKGLNLILSNDIDLINKVKSSIFKEILINSEIMKIFSLEYVNMYDYSSIKHNHVLITSNIERQYKNLSNAITRVLHTDTDFVVIDNLNSSSFIDSLNILKDLHQSVGFLTSCNSFINFRDLILNIFSLDNKSIYNNLIHSLNKIIIPLYINNDLFIFELYLNEFYKDKFINTNITQLKDTISNFLNSQLLPQIDNHILINNDLNKFKLDLKNKLGIF